MAEVELWINKKQLSEHVAIVDDRDAPLVRRLVRRWYLHTRKGSLTFYARGPLKGGRRLYMHQVIIGREPGRDIDHINGNGLDNRLENLRHVTRGENLRAARERQPFRYAPSPHGKGVNKKTVKLADGSIKTYYYAWKGGPRVNAMPGTQEFLALYEAALSERTPENAIRSGVEHL